jgi:CRISPR-associated endonuclease/helicase Cas3
VWRWLETWTREWGGHLVLASGSLPRFWELPEFVDPPKQAGEVPDLLPAPLCRALEAAERVRIAPQRREEPVDGDGLVEWVASAKAPRLLILNTVQGAAVVARKLRQMKHDVLHLSTALAPVHRGRIVEQVKARLDAKVEGWTLVATSCVEAGMNFSFRTGFRECCSTASLIQVGGRVSRGGEYDDAAVWSFRIRDSLIPHHPGFKISGNVLDALFDRGAIQSKTPSQLAKEAMRLEVTDKDENRARDLRAAEEGMEYPTVSRLCRVIDAPTCTVVIDPALVGRLRAGERVTSRELHRGSVQMWATKIDDLAVRPVFSGHGRSGGLETLYEWTLDYDPDFLGYMAGVLPLLDSLKGGIFLA